MCVILQVALPSQVLAAAWLQCGAAGAGASRGLGICAEHARLAARGESARPRNGFRHGARRVPRARRAPRPGCFDLPESVRFVAHGPP